MAIVDKTPEQQSGPLARRAEHKLATDRPVDDAVELTRFTPRLLAILSNIISLRETQALRREFDLGTTDWRILAALAQEPALTATEISKYIVMSKAVISRAVATLVERGLIVQGDGSRGSRPLRLTAAGVSTFRAMIPIALPAQRLIEHTLSAAEIAALESMLVRLIAATGDEDAWAH